MTARERAVARARIRAREQLADLARELRQARLSAGRDQASVAKVAGISPSELSRIELGRPVGLQYETVAAVGAVIGLDVTLRTYPGHHVLQDEAQLRLLRRFRERLGPAWTWRFEAPVAPGDLRAWDSRGSHTTSGLVIVVEAETRVRDLQSVLRRIALKREAADAPRTILLVADTRNNRAALSAGRDEIAAGFPVGTWRAMRALKAGADPCEDCLIVLAPSFTKADTVRIHTKEGHP